MGRQINKTDLAYIAGFLDGDGSIMFQVKNRKDSSRGKRLMFTICLYQDSRHEKPLFWMKDILGIGYISHRSDGMTELRINGYKQVRDILFLLRPYLRFKKEQAELISQVLDILVVVKNIKQLTAAEKRKVANTLLTLRSLSYQSGKKKMDKTRRDIEEILCF